MATIRRQMFDTPHGQVHARVCQGDGLPLLALHQSPRSSRMFVPLMTRVSRPVLAVDRLGYGFSDVATSTPTVDMYAETTMAVVDQLGWDRFSVLGIHTGSVEAVAIANNVPERVDKVGIVAVPVFTEQEKIELADEFGKPRAAPVEDGSHLLSYWQMRLVYRKPPYDLNYLQTLTVEELLIGDRAHLAYQAILEWPYEERLADLSRPLVVFGAHDDLSVQTLRMRNRLPAGSTYLDLPHMGLDLFHLHADEMAALVEEHLPA